MSVQVIPIKVQFTIMKNYCYLVFNTITREALLIDPAWEKSKIELIMQEYKLELKALLITHHHRDHVHLAESFASHYNIPVYMSKIEIDYYKFTCPRLHPIAVEEIFEAANIVIQPIFTPGHTKGCICFLIDNHLFTGDVLFNEGCGVCIGKGSDPNEMFESIQKIKRTVLVNTRIYPGHSFGLPPGQLFSDVLQNNIYLHINNQEHFVNFRMRANQKNMLSFI